MDKEIKPEDIISLMDCSGAKVGGIARYTKEEIKAAEKRGAERMLKVIETSLIIYPGLIHTIVGTEQYSGQHKELKDYVWETWEKLD